MTIDWDSLTAHFLAFRSLPGRTCLQEVSTRPPFSKSQAFAGKQRWSPDTSALASVQEEGTGTSRFWDVLERDIREHYSGRLLARRRQSPELVFDDRSHVVERLAHDMGIRAVPHWDMSKLATPMRPGQHKSPKSPSQNGFPGWNRDRASAIVDPTGLREYVGFHTKEIGDSTHTGGPRVQVREAAHRNAAPEQAAVPVRWISDELVVQANQLRIASLLAWEPWFEGLSPRAAVVLWNCLDPRGPSRGRNVYAPAASPRVALAALAIPLSDRARRRHGILLSTACAKPGSEPVTVDIPQGMYERVRTATQIDAIVEHYGRDYLTEGHLAGEGWFVIDRLVGLLKDPVATRLEGASIARAYACEAFVRGHMS